jgi:hypothetical protein
MPLRADLRPRLHPTSRWYRDGAEYLPVDGSVAPLLRVRPTSQHTIAIERGVCAERSIHSANLKCSASTERGRSPSTSATGSAYPAENRRW